MNTGHEFDSASTSSLFAPITKTIQEGVRLVRSITREDQKEIALAAELGLLGQHEALSAREGLELAREKILGRSKV